MFNSITCQIKKLDRELDGCKERLNALKETQGKNKRGVCFQNKPELPRRSRSAMNKKKIPAERDTEITCKKHCKVQKKISDKCKRNKELSEKKKIPKIKPRSRSVSCGRDCECDCTSENNYLHNDLLSQKHEELVSHKNSWANILKEHNKHNFKRIISNEDLKGRSEHNKYVLNPTSIYLKNRGVQCSETSFVPSRTVSNITGFTPYNPTRTLQFLMSEIRENLKHKREDKVLNIINDMEETVFRMKTNNENLPLYEQKHISNHPYKEQPLNNNLYSTQEVNKVFEEGFARLETTCKTLEITCARLKEENTQLQLELQKKDATISNMNKKEKDHLEKIDLLNKHITFISKKEEQSSESIKDLTKLLHKVQQENKCIQPLKEINTRLDSKINDISKEKDGCLFENQILKLENEKLKVLLEIKEKQLHNYKDIFFGLEDKVRKEVKVMQSRCVSEDSDPDSSAPLCSSPNTSGSIMAPAYGSWRGVSRVSSHADGDARPPSRYPADFHLPHSGKIVVRHVESPKHPFISSKDSASPYDDPIYVLPNMEVPPTQNPLDGIEGIRGQIKMLFSDNCSQMKVTSNGNKNSQAQWTNLNALHSSVTSYNTTT